MSDIAKGAKVAGLVVIILAIPGQPRRGASAGPVVENVACTSLKRRRRSLALRCQITKFGHFLRGHHIYDACMCVLPPKSALR